MHRVKWKAGYTYPQVVDQYICYILNQFGTNTSVVFDGYTDKTTIKDHEHKRRKFRKLSPKCVVKEHTLAYKDQESFLSNGPNKPKCIALLIAALSNSRYNAKQARDEADWHYCYFFASG